MNRKPTKSFFEQDNSTKAKSGYRKKAVGGNTSSRPSNSNSSSSSLPASKDAKSKLSGFAFAKPATPSTSSQADDPDLDTTPRHSSAPVIELDVPADVPTPTKTVAGDVEPVQLPTPRRLRSLSDLPATPKPRLSIEHLLTDEEKAFPDSQPDDRNEVRVTWERSTPGVRMRHKRAASSSPPPIRTPLGKRQAMLSKPTDDPAMELWKKYGLGMDAGLRKDRPANPAVRLFAPDREDRSPSNLRRGTSSETPATLNRLKRRKTQSFELFRESESLESGLDIPAGTIKKASRQERVVSLMDQVKQSMKQKARGKLPILPSSPPPHADSEDPPQSSPLHRSLAAPPQPSAVSTNISTTNDSDSEDFGDFDDADIDMEFIEKVEEIERIASTARQSQALAQSQALEQHTSPPPQPVPPPPPPQSLAQPEAATVLDEFNESGDDDLFGSIEFQELVAQYDAPVKGNASSSRIKRFQVVEVSEGPYELDTRKASRVQKIVRVRDVASNGLYRVMLRDSWATATTVSTGVFVHIVGSFDEHGVCVVDSSHNYIIVNPDFLVSATTVADTVSCMRKAALQERVKATGDISKAMVYGNVLHALFQAALEENDFSNERLNAHIIRVLTDNIESLFLLREEMPVAIAHVQSKIPLIQEWAKLFVSAKPNAKATVADHRGTTTPIVAINKLLDIEEHIWSPKYGLKGNIDATVQAIIVEPGTGKTGKGRSVSKTLTVPLELKTGRMQSMAHRAQTMLYTLLMSDRYDISVGGGLLYYMETNEMIRVPAIRNELRELVIKRNQVAHHICNRETLPEMLEDQHTCSRCYAKTSCFVYHKLLEDGTPESSGVMKPFIENTEHLNDKHKAFFKHWDTLLTKEEKGSVRFRREMWTMTSAEREAAGRCFGELVIVPESIAVDESKQRINKYTYSFEKPSSTREFSFIESQLTEGDPIVVSDEKGHIALAIGYVFQVRRDRITVQVDRRLHNARTRQNNFNADSYQVFNGIVEVNGTPRTPAALSQRPSEREEIFYRIDKDEFSNGMAGVRNNLIQIMAKEANSKYRRLITELLPPEFKESPTAYQLDEVPGAGSLNEDQKNAVIKVMSARDYALVLGMPGTGKTTTIAHIIRALVSQGKSVLLTSYTHTAVDNILLKIKNEKFGILRLGSRAKIHHEVQNFAQLADTRYTTFEELRIAFNRPKVVATTCLGINHPIFSERQFDYCIVDEASQITLPVCLGPIRLAEAFVLVGDHYQLPPLVKNPEAKEGGLDISLFKLLSEAQPQAVVSLEHQYRMCEEIMTLSNELIYSGRLKCGTPEVAKRALKIPDEKGLRKLHRDNDSTSYQKKCWLKDLFAEGVKACFVDTDRVPAREVKKGDRTINPVEAELTYQLVEGFLSCGVDPSSIGVITVYRSQLKTIQHLLRHREKVEMHTADKFQGRDKEIIVISLVRSNDQGTVGELLRDWRRINVAFTRARSKLIILGSRSTLSSNDLLKDFVGLMERNSWVYTLPANAHLHHVAAESMGAASPKRTRQTTGKENQRSPKRIGGKVPQGFLNSRPILKDIMNGG